MSRHSNPKNLNENNLTTMLNTQYFKKGWLFHQHGRQPTCKQSNHFPFGLFLANTALSSDSALAFLFFFFGSYPHRKRNRCNGATTFVYAGLDWLAILILASLCIAAPPLSWYFASAIGFDPGCLFSPRVV